MAVCFTDDEHRVVEIRVAAGFHGRLVTRGDAMGADKSGAGGYTVTQRLWLNSSR